MNKATLNPVSNKFSSEDIYIKEKTKLLFNYSSNGLAAIVVIKFKRTGELIGETFTSSGEMDITGFEIIRFESIEDCSIEYELI